MITYEADEDSTDCELYDNHQPVVVTFDIEHIMLVAGIIGCWKIFSDFRKIAPLGLLGDVIPTPQRDPRIFIAGSFVELLEFSV